MVRLNSEPVIIMSNINS